MNYNIEKISDVNMSELAWLFSEEHGSKFSLEYFNRKFNTLWCGKKHIGFFAKDNNNNPAAFYGGFPCQMLIDESVFLVLHSGDTITHFSHRQKGLFTRLAEHTYQFAEKEGFEYVFGFPNDNSAHGFFQKLDWVHLGSTTTFTFTFRTFNWYGLCHKFSFLKPLYNFFWKRNIKKYRIPADKVFENYKQQYNGVLKDSNFLNYKVNYGDSALVKIQNSNFWIKKDNGIRLGELFLVDPKIDLYDHLEALAKAFGVKHIHFSCNEQHPLFDELKASQSIESAGNMIGIRGLKSKQLPENLAFVAGDSDDF